MKNLKHIDKDSILDAFGLKTDWTSHLGPMIGVFTFGCLLGLGLGLAFAPKAGSELRQDVVGAVKDRIPSFRGADATNMPPARPGI